eukprot:1143283-Pelagomonas_calceolata.AAC.1
MMDKRQRRSTGVKDYQVNIPENIPMLCVASRSGMKMWWSKSRGHAAAGATPILAGQALALQKEKSSKSGKRYTSSCALALFLLGSVHHWPGCFEHPTSWMQAFVSSGHHSFEHATLGRGMIMMSGTLFCFTAFLSVRQLLFN